MSLNEKARNVLIVEDEPLIAMNLEDMLAELGHRVFATATRLDIALAVAFNGDFDLAFLDINLAGSKTFQVAAILRKRRVPFIFTTGYGADGLIEGYRTEHLLTKPIRVNELNDMIGKVLAAEA